MSDIRNHCLSDRNHFLFRFATSRKASKMICIISDLYMTLRSFMGHLVTWTPFYRDQDIVWWIVTVFLSTVFLQSFSAFFRAKIVLCRQFCGVWSIVVSFRIVPRELQLSFVSFLIFSKAAGIATMGPHYLRGRVSYRDYRSFSSNLVQSVHVNVSVKGQFCLTSHSWSLHAARPTGPKVITTRGKPMLFLLNKRLSTNQNRNVQKQQKITPPNLGTQEVTFVCRRYCRKVKNSVHKPLSSSLLLFPAHPRVWWLLSSKSFSFAIARFCHRILPHKNCTIAIHISRCNLHIMLHIHRALSERSSF